MFEGHWLHHRREHPSSLLAHGFACQSHCLDLCALVQKGCVLEETWKTTTAAPVAAAATTATATATIPWQEDDQIVEKIVLICYHRSSFHCPSRRGGFVGGCA